MKNQYFGDVNDYIKYGLLRIIAGFGDLSVSVCWMLTPDDGRSDGRFTSYLRQSAKWREFDPGLFVRLQDAVVRGRRDVRYAEQAGLIPGARFYDRVLPDDPEGRRNYFDRFWQQAQGDDLVFFDPDNGMEVQSRPYGRGGSCKYLYWPELLETVERGHSVLVYQHFPRVERASFVARMAEEMRLRTGIDTLYSFRTARVAFFLLPLARSAVVLERATLYVEKIWANQIHVRKHVHVQA